MVTPRRSLVLALLAGLALPAPSQDATPGGPPGKKPGPVVSPFFPVPGGDGGGGGQGGLPPDLYVPGDDTDGAPVSSGGVRVSGSAPTGTRATVSGGNRPTSGTPPALVGGPQDSWLTWWETNKFDFIELHRVGDDPLTGQGRMQETDEDREARLAEVARTLDEQVLPLLRSLTGADDAAVRAAAIVALGKLRDEQGTPLARELLKDGSLDVRRAAMLALGVLESGRPAYLLMSIAGDSTFGRELFGGSARISPEDRGIALLAGTLRGADEPELLLEQILGEPDGLPNELVAAAAQAAGLAGLTRTIQPLTEVARSDEWPDFVRSAAASALGRLGEPSVVPILLDLLDEPIETRRGAVVALGYAAEPGMTSVVARLVTLMDEDDDAATRHFAAVSLGRLGGEQVRAALRDAFDDPSTDMRPWLALGLGLASRDVPASDVPALLLERVAQESNSEHVGAYLVALGLCGDDAGLPVLRTHLHGGRTNVAAQAAVALGLTGHPDALPILLEGLASASPLVQSQVALGLGVLGNSAAVPQLIDLIRTTGDPYVASFAAIGIAFMGDENAVGPLLRIIETGGGSGVQTTYAIVAVGQLFDTDRRPALSRLAAGDNHLARSSAASQLLALGF